MNECLTTPHPATTTISGCFSLSVRFSVTGAIHLNFDRNMRVTPEPPPAHSFTYIINNVLLQFSPIVCFRAGNSFTTTAAYEVDNLVHLDSAGSLT